jgi:hypothetical protein
VVACGIDPAANQELAHEAAEFGTNFHVEAGDVSDPESVQSVVAKTVGRFGGLDILPMPPPFILSALRSKPIPRPGAAVWPSTSVEFTLPLISASRK